MVNALDKWSDCKSKSHPHQAVTVGPLTKVLESGIDTFYVLNWTCLIICWHLNLDLFGSWLVVSVFSFCMHNWGLGLVNDLMGFLVSIFGLNPLKTQSWLVVVLDMTMVAFTPVLPLFPQLHSCIPSQLQVIQLANNCSQWWITNSSCVCGPNVV